MASGRFALPASAKIGQGGMGEVEGLALRGAVGRNATDTTTGCLRMGR